VNQPVPASPPSPSRRHVLVTGAAALGALGVTSCGDDSSGGDAATADPDGYVQGSAELKVELAPEIDGVIYPEDYQGPRAREYESFGEGKEFTILTREVAEIDLKSNLHSKDLEERTGVKVTYQTVPMGDEGTPKVNAILSSGDLPDAFMLGPEWMGGFSRSELYVYGEQGVFQSVDKMVDEWAPETRALYEMFPDIRTYFTTPNGASYAMPGINQCYHCQSNAHRAWVNKNWLEEVGADTDPTTLDELTALLQEFKKAHPDDFPFSGYVDYPVLRYFAMSYLDAGRDLLRRDGDAITYTPVTDEYREAIAHAAGLREQGLLDPNSLTQNNDQFVKLTQAGGGARIGITMAGSQGELGTVDYEDPDSPYNVYRVIAPVAGPDGGPWVPWAHLPGACKDPETLVRWADTQMGLRATLGQRLGSEDENWEWASEGEEGLDGRQAIYKKKEGGPEENTDWWEWGPYSLTMDVRHGEVTDPNTSIEPSLYEAGKLYEQWATPRESAFIEPTFTTDQAAQVGEFKTNIANAHTQGITNFVLGKADIADDAAWEEYVATINAAGLGGYLDVLKQADEASAG
jgi:putative aldouronate transport system substrate-binding protein